MDSKLDFDKLTIKEIGDHFKKSECKQRLIATSDFTEVIALRFDGKAFHTFTRGMDRPYDNAFMNAMDEATQFTVKELSAKFGYTQSDEATVFLTPDIVGAFVFGGRLEKLMTIGASAMTACFNTCISNSSLGIFDGRAILMSKEEILPYLTWRRMDARKNSINMAAQTLYSRKKLFRVSTSERWDMLVGTEFEVLPEGFFNGRLITATTITPATKEATEHLVESHILKG